MCVYQKPQYLQLERSMGAQKLLFFLLCLKALCSSRHWMMERLVCAVPAARRVLCY